MKKLLLSFLCLGFLSAQAQTADEIISKYAANIGGLEAFKKVQTLVMSGSVTANGMDFPITIKVRNGKGIRSEVDAMDTKIISAYGNGKGWAINPMSGSSTPIEITGPKLNDMKSQVDITPPLMNYKALGNTVSLAGQEDVDGSKAYKINMVSKETGKETNYFIDAKSYVLIKSASEEDVQGQKKTVETFFSNQKEIGGLKFSLNREQKMDGTTFQSINIKDLQLDVPVDEHAFDMPKS